jgi:hypothetical protein
MKDIILGTAEDLVTQFLHNDRDDDEELPVGAIEESITSGEVTIEDIVKTFEDALRKGLLD